MEQTMAWRIKTVSLVLTLLALAGATPSRGQFKPQWIPGQMGLNAGILPSTGFTYINMDVNYEAGTFNGTSGSSVPATGTYSIWAVENIFYFVPDTKVLGGNLGFMIIPTTYASGSLDADITNPAAPNLSAAGGGSGLADIFVQPFTLGWHRKRFDMLVADGVM